MAVPLGAAAASGTRRAIEHEPDNPVIRRPHVKICCIADRDEADRAIAAGASALGLVSAMPSGPGVIDEATIADVAAYVGTRARTFLLTSATTADAVITQHRRLRTTTVQLVDAMAPGALTALREALPDVELVQVVHVTGPASIDEAVAVSPFVDAILLDSGKPGAAVKELGGTGRAHDWSLSARIRDAVPVPLYLAGGLRAHNVAEAIGTVEPYGLDLCTGVRTEGRLDDAKLTAFLTAVRAASPASATSRLVAAFLDRSLPKAEWTHEAHLRVGLWHVYRFGAESALDRLRAAIRAYNVAVGVVNDEQHGYHETITRFYVTRIAAWIEARGGRNAIASATIDADGDAMLAAIGMRDLPLRSWSREVLFSPAARREWVPPDLAPAL